MLKVKDKIKVLIVDDSLLFRETIARGIAKDPSIQVVATAIDPYMARDKILEYEPDVMTLDVELPRMNGIEFLNKLMPQYPIPVVVVSSVSENVFDALKAGAVDFVTKPSFNNPRGVESLINELIIKIKIASTAKVGHYKNALKSQSFIGNINIEQKRKIIAIGASTGGTEAIDYILKAFPKDMPGIVIVQHMPPVFTKMYADRLNNSCNMEIKEAQNGDEVYRGRVLIAPGDYHMRVNKKGSSYYVECFKGEKISGHCPSVDVLFESVAKNAGKDSVGVILTGMGHDGANGLLMMREKGAKTIGQDESSSIVYGMPKVAYDIGAVETQAALNNIPETIFSCITKSK